jgi:acetyltransferase-like isoleucine patch superfamily enzyme
MGQKIIGILFLLLKSSEKLKVYFNSLYCRSLSNSADTVAFLSGSKIVNLRKSKKSVEINDNTIVRGELLVFAHDGYIEIGQSCYVGEGSRIWSAKKITIGNRVLISHNVNIHDTDGHPIDCKERHKHFLQISTSGHPQKDINIPAKSISIEDDVWIGFNSTILKGVNIGKGAIVGASSVVTKDVMPYTVVVGNPAKFVKNIDQNECT